MHRQIGKVLLTTLAAQTPKIILQPAETSIRKLAGIGQGHKRVPHLVVLYFYGRRVDIHSAK